jgi:exosortase H (IPTLxxWG-CTERM-specific)
MPDGSSTIDDGLPPAPRPPRWPRLSAWSARHPIARFVVLTVIVLGAYYAFATTAFYAAHVFGPVAQANAKVAGSILRALGNKVSVSGVIIRSRTFAISIRLGCDAIEPTALLVAAILAFPVPFRSRAVGMLAGAALLLGLNVVRIVSLFLIGLHYRPIFETMHMDVWQIVFVLLAVVIWGLWMGWAVGRGKPRPPKGPGAGGGPATASATAA